MLPFGVTIPASVPQGSEIPEGLINNPVDWKGCGRTAVLRLSVIAVICARTFGVTSKIPDVRFCVIF